VERPDPDDAIIPLGTQCVHQGCAIVHHSPDVRTTVCTYHPGVPVFHEGSKGWSCCSKRTAIFEDFLELPGCTDGKHKFIRDVVQVAQVNVRNDFYQSGDWVMVSFYAKQVDKDESMVKFFSNKFVVKFKLSDGAIYEKEFVTAQPINPDLSKFAVLSTKVEVSLRKTAPGSWAKLTL